MKLDKLSDSSLMLEVKSGKVDKLGLLYERHKRRLFGFYYQMNKNPSLCEDLVQSVFERMLKYSHTYTTESNFISWMFQIARNINYDHFKKTKRTRNHKDITEISDRIEDNNGVEKEIEFLEDTSTLNKALNRLSSEKKEILILSKFKELKYSEIGSIIGCSEGAARTKAHRALNDLRTIFLKLEKQ